MILANKRQQVSVNQRQSGAARMFAPLGNEGDLQHTAEGGLLQASKHPAALSCWLPHIQFSVTATHPNCPSFTVKCCNVTAHKCSSSCSSWEMIHRHCSSSETQLQGFSYDKAFGDQSLRVYYKNKSMPRMYVSTCTGLPSTFVLPFLVLPHK